MIFLKIFLVVFLDVVNGANILAITGTTIGSHLLVLSRFLEHLVPYHNITLYKFANTKYGHPNISVRDMMLYNPVDVPEMRNALKDPCGVDTFNVVYKSIIHDNHTIYKKAFEQQNVKKLFLEKGQYDVAIFNSYGSEHFLIIAHELGLPIIQISPSMPFSSNYDAVNTPLNWDTDPNFATAAADSFFWRISNFIKQFRMHHRFYTLQVPAINKLFREFNPKAPSVAEINEKTLLLFTNTHPAMGYPQSNNPNIINAGGMTILPPKLLNEELETFISHKSGFIYFSLGTTVNEVTSDENILRSIMNVFGKLKQRVLWKWGGNLNVSLPENVKVMKWFSQQDVLRHKNIKLFVTQGGALSLIEAASFGVPVLIMPVFLDQYSNAKIANKMGNGLYLKFCEFTEKKFDEKINLLLTDERFMQKSKQISQIMQRDITDIKGKINFWVDFVVKNKDNNILMNKRKKIQWLERIPVDIFLCLSTIFLFCFVTVTFIFYRLFVYIRSFMPIFKIKIQ